MMLMVIITLKNAGCLIFCVFLSFLLIHFFFLASAFLPSSPPRPQSWPFFFVHSFFSTAEKLMGPMRRKTILSWTRKDGRCGRPGRAPHAGTAPAVASPSVTSLPSWVGWASAFPLGSGVILELPLWKWSITALSMLVENRKFRSVSVYRGHSWVNTSLRARKRESTAFHSSMW